MGSAGMRPLFDEPAAARADLRSTSVILAGDTNVRDAVFFSAAASN
jgi:hypothetical protein